MKVSVIIPAFNAGAFIEKAVQSALVLTQVSEVLVINDGSTDNTLDLLLKIQNDKLKVLQHPGCVNRGRSASRNLGILNRKSPYISFLDADDFYLPNRFDNDELVFQNNLDCDGVYNAIGAKFYRETDSDELKELKLTTIKEKIPPNQLGGILVKGYLGRFSIIGLTIRASAIRDLDNFNTSLEVAEDTEWIWRLAFKTRLYPGIIKKPVAMRGVHNSNSFNNASLYYDCDMKLYLSLYNWSLKKNMGIDVVELFLERIFILHYSKKHSLSTDFRLWFKIISTDFSVLNSNITLRFFPICYKWKFLKIKINKLIGR